MPATTIPVTDRTKTKRKKSQPTLIAELLTNEVNLRCKLGKNQNSNSRLLRYISKDGTNRYVHHNDTHLLRANRAL